MKFTATIFALLAMAMLFWLGRCSKQPAVETMTETATEQTATVEVEPLPIPTDTFQKVYIYKNNPEQAARMSEAERQLDYFKKIVAEKERVIAALGEDMDFGGGVGEPVGNDFPPNGTAIVETQKMNVYNFEETDSITGVRLNGTISVLGYLSETLPPSFSLTYPQSFYTVSGTPVQASRPTERQSAFGIMAGFDQEIGGKQRQRVSGTFYRRTSRLTYGLSGSGNIGGEVAPSVGVRVGVEFGG